jgi:phage/plasmid-associated DNA primase
MNKSRSSQADIIDSFVRECCEQSGHTSVQLKVLFAAYVTWAKSNQKFTMLTKREFDAKLTEKYERRVRGNLPEFGGLQLLEA